MAITITPKQQRVLIDQLNIYYAANKKEKSNLKVNDLPEGKNTPPLEKLFEKEANNKKFLDRVEELRKIVGPEITDGMLRSAIDFGKGWNEEEDKAPTPDAFYSMDAPKEAMFHVLSWDWQMEKKGGPTEDSEAILKKMSPEERDWFIKKLDFPAVWKQPKEGGIGLYGVAPVPKKVRG